MAESSTTPADPREIAADTAADAARAYYQSAPTDLWAALGYALGVAQQVVKALSDVGMLSLASDTPDPQAVAEAMYAVDNTKPLADAHPVVQDAMLRKACAAIAAITGQVSP